MRKLNDIGDNIKNEKRSKWRIIEHSLRYDLETRSGNKDKHQFEENICTNTIVIYFNCIQMFILKRFSK